jgi:hypothetical protein
MKIYCLTAKGDQAYLYAPDAISDPCDPKPPGSIAEGWASPTFELVRNDEYRDNLPKTDFPSLVVGTAVLSARAVDRLRPILTPCGEILPIRCSNDPDDFYLFNVTRIIDAVDMKHSRFQILPSGAIGKCERLVFDPEKLQSALFFKNTQMGTFYDIFASQAVVDAVKKACLTGFDFTQVWSDE